MFSQVLNQIRVNHPDSVDSHELLMAAIEGMVHAADPHSFVVPAVRLSPGARAGAQGREAVSDSRRIRVSQRRAGGVGRRPRHGGGTSGHSRRRSAHRGGWQARHRGKRRGAECHALGRQGVERDVVARTPSQRRHARAARSQRQARESQRGHGRAGGVHSGPGGGHRLRAHHELHEREGRRRPARRAREARRKRDDATDSRSARQRRRERGGSGARRRRVPAEGRDRVHVGGAQSSGHRYGPRLAFLLEERATLSDRAPRELRHGERLRARRRRASGSRSRVDRRTHDVRQVAADARISDGRRLDDRAGGRARAHTLRTRHPAPVSRRSRCTTTTGSRAPIAIRPAVRRARRMADAPSTAAEASFPTCA